MDSLKQAFYDYMDFQFLKRDRVSVFAMFSEKLTGIGTGEDEIGRTKEDFENLYLRDYQEIPQSIEVRYQFVEAVKLSEHSGLVFSCFDILTNIDGQPLEMFGLRTTNVFVKERDCWKLAHKHISMPNGVQEESESYPLKELKRRNEELERMVDEKTRKLVEINEELMEKNIELTNALDEIETLEGILPVCSFCKKIRNKKQVWEDMDYYIHRKKIADVSHSVCPSCYKIHYGEFIEEK